MSAHQPVSTLDAKTPKCHLRIGMSGRKRTSTREGTWDRPANIRKSPASQFSVRQGIEMVTKGNKRCYVFSGSGTVAMHPETLGGTHNGARVPNQEHYVTE